MWVYTPTIFLTNLPTLFHQPKMGTMKEHDAFLRAFGENLKRLRLEKDLSYRKMSQRCEIDYSDISKIEKGGVNIQLSTIFELAKALDVAPRELFDHDRSGDSSNQQNGT